MLLHCSGCYWGSYSHYAIEIATTVYKYYLFNGQRIAMTVNGALRYLHADQLGSTVLTTYTSGARESERGYYAFGSDRRAVGTPATDHRFTGQKVDGSGLYYYNARYYDPVIGQFVSPDTIVPQPGRVFGYNRYMYVMGNPLKYTDPSGHCATTSNGDADENDAECWRLARTIGNMWDSTDYWQSRYGDVNVWTDHISPSGVDAQFMVNELDMFFNSDAGRSWLDNTLQVSRPEQDFGDLTAISVSPGTVQFALIWDDYGNIYIQGGLGFIGPGGSVSRQDILVSSQDGMIDIDTMGLTKSEKRQLAADSIVGLSHDASLGYSYLGIDGSISSSGKGGTVGGGINSSMGRSFSLNSSYAVQIYPEFRLK